MTTSLEVTQLLDELNHPLRNNIEELRSIILDANSELEENLKWNGPNYSFKGNDRITIRVNPPGSLNLILHLGAKKASLSRLLIEDKHSLLVWKSNDRAVVDLKKPAQFEAAKPFLREIIRDWIAASSN